MPRRRRPRREAQSGPREFDQSARRESLDRSRGCAPTSLRMNPGATAFTVTPAEPSSTASARTRASCAALAAAEAGNVATSLTKCVRDEAGDRDDSRVRRRRANAESLPARGGRTRPEWPPPTPSGRSSGQRAGKRCAISEAGIGDEDIEAAEPANRRLNACLGSGGLRPRSARNTSASAPLARSSAATSLAPAWLRRV